MSESVIDSGQDTPTPTEPGPIPPGRITVAVVLGATGSIAADVLAPYEVFARSERFFVYTVAANRTPVALSGGLRTLPDRAFADITTRPDVTVVPGVMDPAGALEAPLRPGSASRPRTAARCWGVRRRPGAGRRRAARRPAGHLAPGRLVRAGARPPGGALVRAQRYVEDGPVTTTAGVTSGTIAALRLVERLAGPAEADRIALSYPGWSRGAGTEIAVNHWEPGDLAFALDVAFPWLRPTVGIGLADGVSEIDVPAVAETYLGASFAARVLPIGAQPTITTRHGLVLLVQPVGAAPVDRIVAPRATSAADIDPRILRWAAEQGLDVELPGRSAPSAFGFDPMLRDLAQHADRATALVDARRRCAGAQPRTATIISISTRKPSGSAATPMADRACAPRSGPKTSCTRSDAASMTRGASRKSGVHATKPSSLTMRSTLSSDPSASRVWASRLSMQSRAAARPSTVVRSAPT